MEGGKGMKKLSKDEKRILKEDVQGLQYLIKMYLKEGNIIRRKATEPAYLPRSCGR